MKKRVVGRSMREYFAEELLPNGRLKSGVSERILRTEMIEKVATPREI